MKVECKISKEYKEPCAVLYINRMTETIGKIISMLEKEHTDSPALIAAKDRKTYFIRPEDISLIRTEGREIVCYDKIKNRYVLDINLCMNWKTCLMSVLCVFQNRPLPISIRLTMWKQGLTGPWSWL